MLILIGLTIYLLTDFRKLASNAGKNIIVPQLHNDNFFEDIGIFTKFRELTPKQILGVFK